MHSKKRVKRLLILSLVLVVLLLAFSIFRSVRKVHFQYTRHPEDFQIVAEYFCAQAANSRFPCSAYRTDFIFDTLPDNEWPPEVANAVHNIFRRSGCNSIYAAKTWGGVNYCIFNDPYPGDTKQATGVVYTPGQKILGGFFYPPIDHWSALADHWFSFTLISYHDYNCCG